VDGLVITQQQADDAFNFFIHQIVDTLVWDHFDPDTQQEHDAIASWIYNVKHQRLKLPPGHPDAYTLREVFNARPRNFDAIIRKWIVYKNPKTGDEKGLYRRRLAELCLMNDCPWRDAWSATLLRDRSDPNVILEQTDPWHVLNMAEHRASVEGSPYPLIPVEVEPLEELPPTVHTAPNVDLKLPPKRAEDSVTVKGISKAESGRETVGIGVVLAGLGTLLPQLQVITTFLQNVPTLVILKALLLVGLGVAVIGAWRWYAGKMMAYEGRINATQTKV